MIKNKHQVKALKLPKRIIKRKIIKKIGIKTQKKKRIIANKSSTIIKPRISHPSGIKNIGNSCYIGSSIQCLRHTNLLWNFILEHNFADRLPSEKYVVFKALSELMKSLSEDDRAVSPQKFKRVIATCSEQFAGTEQCDAQEFLSFLIDSLNEELNMIGEKAITNIFYGDFRSTIKCSECKHQSVSKEPFMCISLPIEESNDTILITLHTQSNHLIRVNFKYDDDAMTVSEMKKIIQSQLIVNSIDIFMLSNGTEVECIDDKQTIIELIKGDYMGKLYAIEQFKELNCCLMQVSITKHLPLFLMSYSHQDQNKVAKLLDRIKKLFLTSCKDDINEAKPLTMNLDFVVANSKHIVGKDIKYISMDIKSLIKASEIKQLWDKLPIKKIEPSKTKTIENLGTLHGCLNNFIGIEKLRGNNQWMCPSCKHFTDADKSIEYLALPKILIIHLKRFKVLGKRSRTKISTLISFPLILIMKTTDTETHVYSLYGVINHVGSIERGHYTAYCRNIKDRNQWIEFDDAKVKNIENTQVVTEKAYVLLYEHT